MMCETHHRAALIQVDGVGLEGGLLRRLIRVLQHERYT